MHIQIRTQDLSLTDSLQQLVHTRLRHALGKLAQRIDEVMVRFEDVNGPRGGEDVHCRIRLHVQPRGEINVSAIAISPSAALSKAAQRAERCLNSGIRRRWMRRRRLRESPSQIATV